MSGVDTEELVDRLHKVISDSGCNCINPICSATNSDGLIYTQIPTDAGESTPKEQVTCEMCGSTWTAEFRYDRVYDINIPGVDLPHTLVNRARSIHEDRLRNKDVYSVLEDLLRVLKNPIVDTVRRNDLIIKLSGLVRIPSR